MRNVYSFLSLITLCFVFTGAVAQRPGTFQGEEKILTGEDAQKVVYGAELVRYTPRSASPNYVRFRAGYNYDADNTMNWLRKMLRMTDADALVPVSTFDDNTGMSHTRMTQTWNGVPVQGSMYIAHAQGGVLHSVNGDYFPGISTVKSPLVTEDVALKKALAYVGASVYKWEIPAEEEFLKRETGNPEATFYPEAELAVAAAGGNVASGEFQLCYRFDIYAQEPFGRKYIFVSAETGEVILEMERIHTADVTGTAVTKYSGTQSFTTDYTGSTYRLREVARGNGIETYDLNTGTSYGAAVDFTDADNFWNNVNPQKDEVATDAHWGAEKTYDFFWTKYSRNSIDGSGFKLLSYVHYSSNYNNAFWDGSRMTYGDGDGSTFTPLTGIDVTGHEITHGLTEFTANLIYSYQSGALNESFSDIFGNAIENYARPADWSWIIGEDITPSGAGIRNMQNPNAFGDPDTYLGTNWYTGTGDNGGVHINSGVQNKWYYILTIGETGTNDLGNAYNVTGQGWVKSSAIAFRNLTVYLSPSSQYTDARFYAIQSAIDLYGPCTNEVIATTNAWYAVGVGGPFVATVTSNFTAAPTGYCAAPATVYFTNSSSGAGTYTWDFGDGGTSTLMNPSHVYAAYGTYTVRLIADGGACGRDTLIRTAYIVVDSNLACSVSLSPTGINSTQTACSGSLFDTGGPTGNYLANMNSVITIAPPGASYVSLTFTSFSYENGYDYLRIYNGPTTGSPLIGSYTNTALPGGGTVSSTASSITVREQTDPAVEQSGFALTWQCFYPTTAPTVNFTADATTSCNGTIKFTDLSTGAPSSWLWNFGDGFTSTLQHPTHTYMTNGTFTVSLTATNVIGSATHTKTAYITINKPAGPTAPPVSRCGPGTVTLTASATGTISWYTSALSTTPVATGSPYVTPSLSSSTVYYVENRIPATSQYVGPPNRSFGTGGYHNNTTDQYQIFTVSQPMKLVSVWVDPGNAGNRTIKVWNSTGTLLWDTTMNIGSATTRININRWFTPGSYRIGGNSMDLYRNNAGASYPYTIPGVVSITGSSAGSAFYYYFYDWEVRTVDCISLRTAVPVTINPLPTATITPSPGSTVCTGNTVTLTAGGGTSYVWSTGATTTSVNVTSAVPATNTYTVTVTDASGCQNTTTSSVTWTASPTATVTPGPTVTGCVGETVTLNATGGGTYSWSTGGTTSSIGVTSASAGSTVYSVTATLSPGCSGTASTTVVWHAPPSASISALPALSACAGETVTLTAAGGSSYLWSTGATSSSINVSSASAASTSYSVTVTDGFGCDAVSSATVTWNALPSASISSLPSLTVCEGESVTLTASGGSGYLWSTGATTSSIVVSSASAASLPYSVSVTNAAGCDAVSSATVTWSADPVASISALPSLSVCAGETVTLTAGGGTGYLWSTGATTSSINVTSAAAATTTYSVTVTNAAGCEGVNTASVTWAANPAASISALPSLTACAGETVTLTATGGTSYLWSTGATTSSINVTSASAGSSVYSVTVTNAAGCDAASSATVSWSALPSVSISSLPSLSVCEGEIVTLTASGGGTYLWSTGATTAAITVTSAVAASASYSVTVTSAAGCEANSSATVTWSATPVASVSALPSLDVCAGDPFTLTASGGTAYLWSTGDMTASITVPSASAGPVTYSVTVTDGPGCESVATATVTGHTITAAFSSSSTGATFNFTDLTSGAVTWDWTFGDGGTSTVTNPVYTYVSAGTYAVTLIVTDAFGCTDTLTDSVYVIINALSETASQPFEAYPNPFTEELVITGEIATSGAVSLDVTDALGRQLRLFREQFVPAGAFRYIWKPDATFADGVYFLTLRTGDTVHQIKVVHITR